MSGDEGQESLGNELAELVDRLDPQIQAILVRYCIPETRASKILYEAMMGLAHRWNKVRDRERWLLDALEHACADEGTQSPPDA